MKVLVIGGTNFVGPRVVGRLAEAGHEVVVFHRGRTEAELPEGVERILGDRGELGASPASSGASPPRWYST